MRTNLYEIWWHKCLTTLFLPNMWLDLATVSQIGCIETMYMRFILTRTSDLLIVALKFLEYEDAEDSSSVTREGLCYLRDIVGCIEVCPMIKCVQKWKSHILYLRWYLWIFACLCHIQQTSTWRSNFRATGIFMAYWEYTYSGIVLLRWNVISSWDGSLQTLKWSSGIGFVLNLN